MSEMAHNTSIVAIATKMKALPNIPHDEVLCAISLMLGYKVRLSAAIMAASLLISLLFLFPGKGFGTSELLFVYLGIQVALVISGGGVYSLDALASAKRAKSQRTRNSSRRIEDSTKK